jgi:hypothetical protein
VRILDAIRKRLPDALSGPGLEKAVLDYLRLLGHDSQRRICKLYGSGLSERFAMAGGLVSRSYGPLNIRRRHVHVAAPPERL